MVLCCALVLYYYLFVVSIINVTATTDNVIPIIMLEVIISPNATAPTRIAVIGSKTPSTEAFVAPMFLVAIANVAVEIIVGKMASPIKLSHAEQFSSPVSMGTPENAILMEKTIEPTKRA